MLLKEWLSNVQKAVNTPNCVCVCVYNYAVILCKMQRYRQLSNVGIIVGGIHVIVVTWARGICLICMPKARGPQARELRAYILGKSRVPMLQLLCNTFLASCAQAKGSVKLQQLYL